jgi:hypothetical protein
LSNASWRVGSLRSQHIPSCRLPYQPGLESYQISHTATDEQTDARSPKSEAGSRTEFFCVDHDSVLPHRALLYELLSVLFCERQCEPRCGGDRFCKPGWSGCPVSHHPPLFAQLRSSAPGRPRTNDPFRHPSVLSLGLIPQTTPVSTAAYKQIPCHLTSLSLPGQFEFFPQPTSCQVLPWK